jgi:hypothetical protein
MIDSDSAIQRKGAGAQSVAWVCERASEKPCNKADISHWYMVALMGLWKAPLWHLGLVSASNLLLGEEGKPKEGSQQRHGLQSLHHKCSRNRVGGLSWIVPR